MFRILNISYLIMFTSNCCFACNKYCLHLTFIRINSYSCLNIVSSKKSFNILFMINVCSFNFCSSKCRLVKYRDVSFLCQCRFMLIVAFTLNIVVLNQFRLIIVSCRVYVHFHLFLAYLR